MLYQCPGRALLSGGPKHQACDRDSAEPTEREVQQDLWEHVEHHRELELPGIDPSADKRREQGLHDANVVPALRGPSVHPTEQGSADCDRQAELRREREAVLLGQAAQDRRLQQG